MLNSKPQLVLLHGWGVNSRVWDSLHDRLTEAFDVVPLDLRGYGSLADQATGDDLFDLADDVLQRAPQSAVWCGWSLGGMVSLAAALKAPDRIEQLHLICTTPRFMFGSDWPFGATETLVDNLAVRFEKNYATALARFFLLQFGSANDARQRSRAITSVVQQDADPSWQTLEQGLNLLRTVDLRGQTAQIDLPTTVYVGMEDRVVSPDAGRWLADSLPNAELVEMEGGHVPFLSSPHRFADRLIDSAGVN